MQTTKLTKMRVDGPINNGCLLVAYGNTQLWPIVSLGHMESLVGGSVDVPMQFYGPTLAPTGADRGGSEEPLGASSVVLAIRGVFGS